MFVIHKGFVQGCFVKCIPSNEKDMPIPLRSELFHNLFEPEPQLTESSSPDDDMDFALWVYEKGQPEDMISIRDEDFYPLKVFLHCAHVAADENDDVTIPMLSWKLALKKWMVFIHAKSFDDALERCGVINYTNWSCDSDTMWHFNTNGIDLWTHREEDAPMVEYLLNWTAKYEKQFRYIMSYGF